MKVKTSELVGLSLNWAVAKSEDYDDQLRVFFEELRDYGRTQVHDDEWVYYAPSTDWAQGGRILEMANISLAAKDPMHDYWAAMTQYGGYQQNGPTPLIAICRCFVVSKLGNEVDIPDDFLRRQKQ